MSGDLQLVTGNLQLVTGNLQLVTGNLQLVTGKKTQSVFLPLGLYKKGTIDM